MPTQEQINEYITAMVAAAISAGLQPSDLAAIVTIGGITTQISKINAQIELQQDAFDEQRSEHQDAVATLNTQKATLQAQLKAVVGG